MVTMNLIFVIEFPTKEMKDKRRLFRDNNLKQNKVNSCSCQYFFTCKNRFSCKSYKKVSSNRTTEHYIKNNSYEEIFGLVLKIC